MLLRILSDLIIIILLQFNAICDSKYSLDCCLEILPENYELYKATGSEVYVAFQVLDIGEIDEGSMSYLFHVYVNTAWKDNRIEFNKLNFTKPSIFLPACCLKNIWNPDIFYETVKHIENFQSSEIDLTLEVFSGGTLFKSKRYLFKSGCNMDFTYYPFDVQKCLFLVGMMHPDSEATLKWIDDDKSPFKDAVQVLEMVRHPEPLQFYLLKPTLHSITEIFGDRSYTSLITNITLVRRLSGSIINTYTPSTLIVIMSWITFWLETDAVPARVALSVTSLLTLCTQVEHYRSQLPPVSYMKAMDIWLFVCIFVVFSTLVEFAISYNIASKLCEDCSNNQNEELQNHLKENKKPNKRMVLCSSWSDDSKNVKKAIHPPEKSAASYKLAICLKTQDNVAKSCERNKRKSQFVDNMSKKIYPLFFTLFAVIYWAYFLNKTKISNSLFQGVAHCQLLIVPPYDQF
ncbi:glycine receptor subunit alpha-3 [Parasteatoda tepidariorum]|uniref:glycine receptor subunit alpha-3 n=1 Tax=Parasteatoda tepidariorum TaxID=114398 RepID=UPI0039BC6844